MPKPQEPIRRFDVFAEFNRQEQIKEGMPADQAKGYGLWLAKVVAARRYGAGTKPAEPAGKQKQAPAGRREQAQVSRGKWRRLSGKPQTDKLFDREIVSRMGRPFYSAVFVPAIRKSIARHESYVDIRDSIRKNWVPE